MNLKKLTKVNDSDHTAPSVEPNEDWFKDLVYYIGDYYRHIDNDYINDNLLYVEAPNGLVCLEKVGESKIYGFTVEKEGYDISRILRTLDVNDYDHFEDFAEAVMDIIDELDNGYK